MRGGVFFIRHLGFPHNWGMVIRFRNVQHDAAALKRRVIMTVGEFLERANLRRGVANDDPVGRIEGVPEKYQPPETERTYTFDNVIVNETVETIRTNPRPQAFQEMVSDGD